MPKFSIFGDLLCEHDVAMPNGCNPCQRSIGEYDKDGQRIAVAPKDIMGHAIPPGEIAKMRRDKTSAERKAEPIHSGALMYFPDALAAVARLSKAGNDKHNPGEPLHWARGKSTDHMDCLVRHTLTKDTIDPETGEAELVATVWRALAQLQLDEERRLAAKGVKSYSGIAP